MHRAALALGMAAALTWAPTARADDEPAPLAKGVRGLITRASGPMLLNGRLDEFSEAFCTPVHYNHRDRENRPAQFFYGSSG